jgi:hypothetical protein
MDPVGSELCEKGKTTQQACADIAIRAGSGFVPNANFQTAQIQYTAKHRNAQLFGKIVLSDFASSNPDRMNHISNSMLIHV